MIGPNDYIEDWTEDQITDDYLDNRDNETDAGEDEDLYRDR